METHGGILDGYMREEKFCEQGDISRRTAARYRNEPNGLPYLEFGGKIYIPIDAARVSSQARAASQSAPQGGVMSGTAKALDFKDAQLELFAIKCSELADRVSAGKIKFLDAIDMGHSAAIWSGLVDAVGDDTVQTIMAAAFGGIGKKR